MAGNYRTAWLQDIGSAETRHVYLSLRDGDRGTGVITDMAAQAGGRALSSSP